MNDLNLIAQSQNWNDKDLKELALRFLREKGMESGFSTFVEEVAASENTEAAKEHPRAREASKSISVLGYYQYGDFLIRPCASGGFDVTLKFTLSTITEALEECDYYHGDTLDE